MGARRRLGAVLELETGGIYNDEVVSQGMNGLVSAVEDRIIIPAEYIQIHTH